MKQCTVCQGIFSLSNFYHNAKVIGGFLNQCIPCVRAAQRERNAKIAADPVLRRAEKLKKRAAYERRLYGMTRSDLMEMQGHRCPICEKDLRNMRENTVVIDHCHGTGRVRGLICHSCNVGLGRFNDSPEMLARALDYLRRSSV